MQIKKIIKSKRKSRKKRSKDGSRKKRKDGHRYNLRRNRNPRVVNPPIEPTIYCGNNRLHSELQNGNAILGSRHRCLQKGFGVGFYTIPVDMNMLLPYEPIYPENIYCGNDDNLPDNYERFGSLSSCFQKGVGIGKKKRAEQNQH